jgi:protein-tyrosine phosphatase
MHHPLQVLVVCEGNMCRSPMAMALLRKFAFERNLEAEISSAGTMHGLGSAPYHPWATELCHEMGLDLGGKNRSITPDMLKSADIIFAMDARNVNGLFERDPNAGFLPKLYLFGEFLEPPALEIPDPMGKSKETFANCLKSLEMATRKATDFLASWDRKARKNNLLPLLEKPEESAVTRQIREWAEKKFSTAKMARWTGAQLADGRELFDLILAEDFFETVLPARAEAALLQLKRRLAPNGVLVLAAPNRARGHGRYSAPLCREIAETAFGSVEMAGADFERGLFQRVLHRLDFFCWLRLKPKSASLSFRSRGWRNADYSITLCRIA